jgi:hypothetical protein
MEYAGIPPSLGVPPEALVLSGALILLDAPPAACTI